ncbi:MAG: DUF4870 domain-containing protein [Candidatus Aenigmatarchaeota archaeon]
MPEKQTVSGLEENVAGALSYLLGFITGIVFLLSEKESHFVRFHAVQSIIFSLGIWFLSAMLGLVFMPIPNIGPTIASFMSYIVGYGGLILWIFLMYKAFRGERYKLPVVGDYAEKYAKDLEI